MNQAWQAHLVAFSRLRDLHSMIHGWGNASTTHCGCCKLSKSTHAQLLTIAGGVEEVLETILGDAPLDLLALEHHC